MIGPGESVAVPLPEPLGRRPRLGPFPSSPAALKFAAIAAVGAAVAGATAAVVWVPFLLGGFALVTVRKEDRTMDGLVTDYLRWRFRAARGGRRGRGAIDRPPLGQIATGPGGARIAILETGGLPIAFLPRRDAETLFDGFRALLRAHGHGLYLHVRAVRIPSGSLRPASATDPSSAEATARAGYREMVGLLTRSRRARRVQLVTWTVAGEPDGLAQLEGRVEALYGGLSGLGLAVERLEGAALRRAMESIGWTEAGR